MKTFNRRDFLRTSGAAALFAATPGLAYSQVIVERACIQKRILKHDSNLTAHEIARQAEEAVSKLHL